MPLQQNERDWLGRSVGDRGGFGLGLGLNRRQRGFLRGATEAGQLDQLLAQRKGIARRLGRANEGTQLELAQKLGVDPNQLPAYTGPLTAGFGTGSYGFNPTQRQQLRQAARAGTIEDLLGNSSYVAGQVRSMNDAQRQQLAAMLRIDPKMLGKVPAAPGTPENPLVDPGTNVMNVTNTTGNTGVVGPMPNAPGGGTSAFDTTLGQFQNTTGQAAGTLNNFYTQGLKRLTMAPQSSYEDMFKNYQDVANREAERQAAAINEAFGARGGRYSSDLLTAQGDLRARMAAEGRQAADQFAQQLNAQRLSEQNSLGAGLQGVMNDEEGRRARAQQLFQLAYLRDTAPPQLLQAASQYASNFGNPNTLVY